MIQLENVSCYKKSIFLTSRNAKQKASQHNIALSSTYAHIT